MSKVLIDRELLERAVYRLELAYDADAPIVCDLSSVLSAPSGTPAMPVKAYYHEAPNEYGGLNKSVGLEVRREFADAPLVLEADALARIACLEGEIAKRDARIVELEYNYQDCNANKEAFANNAISLQESNTKLRAELAAIKAQEPVWSASAEIAAFESFDYADRCFRLRREGQRYVYATTEKELELFRAGAKWGASLQPVPEAKARGVVMPERLKPSRYELHDAAVDAWNSCLDEVARLNAAPVQQVSVPDGFCIGAWRDALEKIAKYAPQVNCAARTELERAGLIAVHALIAFSAPQFRHARGTQTASNAAPAAPAADAGHVFYGMDGNHP